MALIETVDYKKEGNQTIMYMNGEAQCEFTFEDDTILILDPNGEYFDDEVMEKFFLNTYFEDRPQDFKHMRK